MLKFLQNSLKLRIALLTAIFLGLLTGYYFRLVNELSALKLIQLDVVAVGLDTAVIPMLVFVPSIFVLLAGFIKRWPGRWSEQEVTSGLWFIIGSVPLFLLVWVIYSWQHNRWVSSADYERCHWLTGSTFGAPTIWVRDRAYCIQDAHRISSHLVEWAGEQARIGNDVSADEFALKISDLNLAAGLAPNRKQ